MNSKERFLAVLQGKRPDRALTAAELQQAAGCHVPEIHLDAERLAWLGCANHEVPSFDAVTFNINDFGEPAALGSEMDIISPRCAISPRCTNANLRAMVDAVIRWHAHRAR